MKIECAMWNEKIDGLATNHNPISLPKQKQIWILYAKKMEFKIDLKDVSW
jgi:hypothetical protein